MKQYNAVNEKQHWSKLLMILMLILGFGCMSSAIGQDEKAADFHADFMTSYDRASGKLADLAAEISADKYDWRPAEGVRSVKESLMHVAAANYFLASVIGKAIPEGVDPRGLEKTVETKEEAEKVLKASVEHFSAALADVSAEGLNDEVEYFGMKGTRRSAVLPTGDHMAEHLGQMIAYARMIGVVPPWSQKQGE